MRSILNILLILFFTTSCNKDDLKKNDNSETNKVSVVGEKLENPYSLKNMNKAYINLLKQKGHAQEISRQIALCEGCNDEPVLLKPTHTYVKILPQDSSHYDALLKDTNFVFFDFPIDYEISEGENVIHKDTNTNGFTYLYTKIPVDKPLPSILLNVIPIESLYIPVEEDDTDIENISIDKNNNIISLIDAKINFYDLLDESMRLTGHKNQEIEPRGLFGSKWRASANIKAYDDKLGSYIPLKRAKVRARHLFHWKTRYTDNNGNADFGTFRYRVKYSIIWEGDQWDIRDGKLWQAYYNGPRQKSAWNLQIRGGKSGHYAMIHRACVRYFKEDNGGLRKPISSSNLKIAYLDKNNNDVNGFFAPWTTWTGGILRNITIYSTVQNKRRYEFDIFSTAIHEIAHYAHSKNMGVIQFYQVSNNIGESWARAVQWHLGNLEYSRLLPPDRLNDLVNDLAVQYWGSYSKNKAYSPLFIDLVDDYNQSILSSDYPNDNVKGYTMSQLNNILTKVYGLSSLKAELKKNKPSGVTDLQIDQLFTRYEQLL